MAEKSKWLEEEIFKNQRKKDINYLIGQKVAADDSEAKPLKPEVSKINSVEVLNKLWKFLVLNSPNLDELEKKVSEFIK